MIHVSAVGFDSPDRCEKRMKWLNSGNYDRLGAQILIGTSNTMCASSRSRRRQANKGLARLASPNFTAFVYLCRQSSVSLPPPLSIATTSWSLLSVRNAQIVRTRPTQQARMELPYARSEHSAPSFLGAGAARQSLAMAGHSISVPSIMIYCVGTEDDETCCSAPMRS